MDFSKLIRLFIYFRRAHSTYFAFFIQLINFASISYLLFINLLHFPSSLMFFVLYILLIVLIYVPLCIYVGWFDYRKGAVPRETELIWRNNPVAQDLLKAIYYIACGENEKAIQILRKYVEKQENK